MHENQISSHSNLKDVDLSTKLFGGNTKVTGNIPNPDQLKDRGLISDVEYKLEDVLNRLTSIDDNLNQLFSRIFDVSNVDGDTEKDMSKPNSVYSPNYKIRDKFKDVDNLLLSINKVIENLDKSL